jgi:hypothetical protein
MNLPDSRVLINENPCLKRSRIATESPQNLALHHHSPPPPPLLVLVDHWLLQATGHCHMLPNCIHNNITPNGFCSRTFDAMFVSLFGTLHKAIF